MLVGINTSTLQFSIALLSTDGALLGECYLSAGKAHFGGLFPALDFLLTNSGRGKKEIECVAVAVGPGSFTGLRVGLSSAKGLCHALDVPIIGISSLEALGAQMHESHLPVTALLESRRNDVFVAQFKWDSDKGLTRLAEDQCLEYSDLARELIFPCLFVGNSYHSQVPRLKESLSTHFLLAPPEMWTIRASSVAALALERFSARDFDDPAALVPVYLRPPDIRPNPYQKMGG